MKVALRENVKTDLSAARVLQNWNDGEFGRKGTGAKIEDRGMHIWWQIVAVDMSHLYT